jgi:rubrerythrin
VSDVEAGQAILSAIRTERESLRSYLGFAWETTDLSGKNMFIRLATDEFEHARLLETWTGPDAGRSVPVDRTFVEKLVPRLSDVSLRIRGTSGQGQLSALNTALELEQTAVRFYREHAGRARSDSARLLFARLVEMETAHAALIQAELDSILQTGFWFGMPEFSLEVEAG